MASERLNWRGIEITIEPVAHGHRATAAIPTRMGTVVYQCTAEIPPAVYDYLRSIAPEVASGDFFGDLSKGFRQMTKSSAFSQVTGIVSQVAQNPLFTMALGAVAGPAAVPIASTVGNLAGAAHNLAQRARAGDPKARRAVGNIARKARAGDPKARRAAQLLREASRQQDEGGPRLDQLAGSLLGPLGGALAGKANTGDYASLVARYAGGALGAALDTKKGEDGAYEVVSGAEGAVFRARGATRNPYCHRATSVCDKAYPHTHFDGSFAPYQFYGSVRDYPPPPVSGGWT